MTQPDTDPLVSNEANLPQQTVGGHGPPYGAVIGPKMPNEANFGVFDLRTGVTMGSQANSGRGGAAGGGFERWVRRRAFLI